MNVNTVNAYYPNTLKERKKSAAILALSGGALTTSACALYFLKQPLAVKHPWFLAAAAFIGTMGAMIGISNGVKNEQELKKYEQVQPKSVIKYNI